MEAASTNVKIPVASLRVGEQLPFPIYENKEILLLKKGAIITPKFLAALHDRGISEIMLDDETSKQLAPPPTASRTVGPVTFENAASKAADQAEFIDAVAAGAALIDSFKPRSNVAYDKELMEGMMKSCEQDVNTLSQQLGQIVEGSNEMPGRDIEKMTTTYIWHMAQDLDAAISVSQAPNKNEYLAGHALQMSIMGMALAAQMKLPEEEVRVVGISAMLHDMGMHKIPEKLREAKRRLNAVEFFEVAKHPVMTLELTEKVLGIPNRCRLVVYQVHERADGTGYPRRRTGNKTYLAAKVLGIVDAYLAMIHERPWRPAVLPYQAMAKILEEAKVGKWEPSIIRSFLSLTGLFPVGSFVMLNDGSVARVVRAGGENFAKPQVNITHNADGNPQDSETLVDLAQTSELSIVKAIPPLFM